MPVGVPKIPEYEFEEEAGFEDSESEDGYQNEDESEDEYEYTDTEGKLTWVDLPNLLYEERILFLTRKINNELSNQLLGLMTYLSIEDETTDLTFFINSLGGWVKSGLAIYDMMQAVPPDVNTIGGGIVASMASLILAGGENSKRIAFPHARIMIHQPVASFSELETGDLSMEINAVTKMRKTITKEYAKKTGQSVSIIYTDMERDFFMSAQEAQVYGIVDSIADEVNKK
uniref:ATP-dependent Clp protease proteolytic subunit n=1 Tax=Cladopus yinggelingensis TaxID=3073856 RepID=A0AA51UA04_9ROSI|nr:ATP-dependent Clp protease proteolytic subunit 1 [Cladopus fukienensis]YP_010954013.1 ATP-dependent Clp protease proteolytic subunit 1 [Cladopus pierrei]YP_010954092.1 ATP-dependent Clp protease proteolytic subunit 1 [Cladopus yinggelingensis]WMV01329.1 ATP-dependent Clp protease proteolytic subunit 1 [Cladopus fukienensis]WMV01408.1 ATP-dependent Clp protease proteolytic subunit 1 [Cladopus pierrei]WMV01487.1 ATP-dependent Clp protease proteolytic subunit 1 [Cladopus yinggelingensis]